MRRLRSAIVIPSALVALLLNACGGTPPSPPESDAPGAPADETAFRIVAGDTVLTGHLFDNAAARDLAAQLPLTVTFRDLNGVEKTAPLLRKLTMDGMPAGEDPQVGDLGYWAPDGDLVVYYGDVGFWTGLVRLGEIDGDVTAIARHSGDFSATVELAR
ncbi:MAG: cyclophilin-like fold protein [Mycobacterium sp.]